MSTQARNSIPSRTIEGLSTRTLMSGMLILGGIIIAVVAANFGFAIAMVVSAVPIVLLIGFGVLANPYWGLMIVFTINYFIMGVVRYFPNSPIGGGQIMDLFLLLTIVGVIIMACYQRLELKKIANGLTVASGLWMLYCTMELFNLEDSSFEAWFTSVRGVALYFFILAIITPLIFSHVRDIRRIMYLWSAFTIAAAMKAYIQKTYGFDQGELYWLYVSGGDTTHLIHTGIRFFSFFTDAANFGGGMGFSLVTFTVIAINTKNLAPKLYFFFVAFLGGYGMMISGTRGAIAVPFMGYALYILLSRNWKIIIIFSIFLSGIFFFLKNTTHLEGNTYVRRMRTAFNPKDPSLLVRLENQRKMRVYLSTRPFGVGIGMGGGKAKDYAPHAYMSQLPTDSWFVMLWAETGIVGLLFYIAILVYLVIHCSIIIMFKIKHKQLRGVLAGFLAGIFGIILSSTGNEILGQFPTGFIIYILFAFIYMGPAMDKYLAEHPEESVI